MQNSFRGQYDFKVDGVNYFCLINMNALRIMCKSEDISFSKLDEYLGENPFESVPKLIYYGVKNHLIRQGQSVDDMIDFEQFCAQALDEPGLFEQMTSWVTESLGGDAEKKTRAARRKAPAKK
jgi:hypothetical protein